MWLSICFSSVALVSHFHPLLKWPKDLRSFGIHYKALTKEYWRTVHFISFGKQPPDVLWWDFWSDNVISCPFKGCSYSAGSDYPAGCHLLVRSSDHSHTWTQTQTQMVQHRELFWFRIMLKDTSTTFGLKWSRMGPMIDHETTALPPQPHPQTVGGRKTTGWTLFPLFKTLLCRLHIYHIIFMCIFQNLNYFLSRFEAAIIFHIHLNKYPPWYWEIGQYVWSLELELSVTFVWNITFNL